MKSYYKIYENSIRKYLCNLTSDERWNILNNCLERLMEIDEVRYLQDDYDVDEDIIWSSCGESLTKRD